MLHEILLALLGHPGSIVVSEGDYIFKVADTIDFLTEAEKEQINRIVVLGVFFRRINGFMERKGGLNSRLSLHLGIEDLDGLDEEGYEDSGFYVKAFCAGVKEVLNLYKEHVLAIEHEYFVNESLNISHLN